MKKTPLTDGSGRWFDLDSVRKWERHISSEEEHYQSHYGPEGEYLCLTRKGTFILHSWKWDREDSFTLSDMEKGAAWLISNGYQEDLARLDLLPEEQRLEV